MECYNFILYVYYDYYKTFISYPFTFCDMYEFKKCDKQKNLSKMKFEECSECGTCQLKTYLKNIGKCPENCNAIALFDVEKINKVLNCNNNDKESKEYILSKCIFEKIPFKDDYVNAINLQKEKQIIDIAEILIISLFTNMCQNNHETFSVLANILCAKKNDENFTESSNVIYKNLKYTYESNVNLNNQNIFENTDIGVMFLQALNLKEEYSKINGKLIYINYYKYCLMNCLKLHFSIQNKTGYPNV